MRILVTNHHDFFEVTSVLPNTNLIPAFKGLISKAFFNVSDIDRVEFTIMGDGRLKDVSFKVWGVTQRGNGFEDVPTTVKLNIETVNKLICDRLEITSSKKHSIFFNKDRTVAIFTDMQVAPQMVKLPTHTVQL